MIKLFWLALGATLFVNPADAESKPDSCFAVEGERVTLRGTIIQSITLEKNDGTGESAHHKFMAIALEKPICFSTEPPINEYLVKAFPIPAKALGHCVAVIGNLVLDEDLSITVEGIKDICQ